MRLLPVARIVAYPLWFCVKRTGAAQDVAEDVDWWAQCIDNSDIAALDRYSRFAFFCGTMPEFRTLVHLRLRSAPLLLRVVLRAFYRRSETLLFEVDRVGPALFIQHGVGTLIGADSIGSHCWINQNVTVGSTAKGRPTVGDRVRIGVGAVVLGPITIHDDATIGANATVMRDVGPGETVVAPLAVPLKRRQPD
ncbi:serine acetyltransferase [Mycolicibacterium peregrinum]|nr:serine acetyltransferase [Mycolicibacterium peregrinum]